MSRDPYLVLDLHPGASLQEIQEAYQRLSTLYDEKHQTTEEMRVYAREKMRELNEAYQALCGGQSGDFRQDGSRMNQQGNPYSNTYTQGGNPWGSASQNQQYQQYQQNAYPRSSCMGGNDDGLCGKLICGLCAWEMCCDSTCCC